MTDEKKTLEMRIAELEDKLAQVHITEEEMATYNKVAAKLGATMVCHPCQAAAPPCVAQPTPFTAQPNVPGGTRHICVMFMNDSMSPALPCWGGCFLCLTPGGTGGGGFGGLG